MRLDFNILWVDDLPESVAEDIEDVKSKIEELGFNPLVEVHSSLDSVTEWVEAKPQAELDLVVMDFKLTGGTTGLDVATVVRRHFRHREIILYSSSAVGDLKKQAGENLIEGVWFGQRDNLPDDVFDVVENLLRKVLDLTHMRGLVIAETSQLDFLIARCVEAVHDKFGDDEKTAALAAIIQDIEERLDQHRKYVEEHATQGDFGALMEDHRIVHSANKIRFVQRHFGSFGEEGKELQKKIKSYAAYTGDVRNSLAHAHEERDPATGAKIIVRRAKPPLTAPDMVELRKELLDHRRTLMRVVAELGVDLGDRFV